MSKEDFIKKITELANEFWTMNLHDGTFESNLTEIVNEYESNKKN